MISIEKRVHIGVLGVNGHVINACTVYEAMLEDSKSDDNAGWIDDSVVFGDGEGVDRKAIHAFPRTKIGEGLEVLGQ